MGMILDPYLGAVRDDRVTLAALAAVGVGPRYIKVGTLAEVLAVTGSYGDDALVTNLGTGGTGTLVRWGSSGWRIPYDQTLALDSTPVFAAATTSEVVVKQASIPAGFSALMSGLLVEMGWQKSGITAAASNCRLRIGSTGTTSDAFLINSGGLIAANRSLAGSRRYHFFGASTLHGSGTLDQGAADFAFLARVNSSPLATVINDTMTTDTVVSLTVQMASTADQPGAYFLKVVGLS